MTKYLEKEDTLEVIDKLEEEYLDILRIFYEVVGGISVDSAARFLEKGIGRYFFVNYFNLCTRIIKLWQQKEEKLLLRRKL